MGLPAWRGGVTHSATVNARLTAAVLLLAPSHIAAHRTEQTSLLSRIAPSMERVLRESAFATEGCVAPAAAQSIS